MQFEEFTKLVLFEDNHLLVVNKPAGMLTQADNTGDPCLLDHAKNYIKIKESKTGNIFIGLVHRLDRPVSGIVVLAKTSKALARMNDLFKNKNIVKTYHALVKKTGMQSDATLENYIRKDNKALVARVYNKEVANSKKAILHYKILCSENGYTTLEIQLETGRFHQIRAQLSNAGMPIVGDVKYGYPVPKKDRSILLHAASIEFEHPVKKVPVKINAPYHHNWK